MLYPQLYQNLIESYFPEIPLIVIVNFSSLFGIYFSGKTSDMPEAPFFRFLLSTDFSATMLLYYFYCF